MKLALIYITLLLFALLFSADAKTHHRLRKKLGKRTSTGYIHPKYRRMLWDPNWGDKDKLTDDGTAEPGVINSQLEKIEEYRRAELKKGLFLMKKQRSERTGNCRSHRA